MNIKHSIKTAFNSLIANKGRASLTILGIVIGITSIMLVMSLGQGAQDYILNEIQSLGANTIAVIPGRQPKGPSDFASVFADSLRAKDLRALNKKENAPTVSRVMPIVFGSESAAFGGETYRLTVFGASDAVASMFNIDEMEEGRMFTEDEVKSSASVVVLGQKAKQELFGDASAIGQKIRVKNRALRVIGVLPKKGQVSFFNFDDMGIMPYSTAQKYIFGISYFHRFIVEARLESEINLAVADVTATLRESHNIIDPEKDDFFVETSADLADSLKTITTSLTLFLMAVAAISLIVGGISIMNIMLVSVSERTREIGLRKALGASDRDIMRQFLFESLILTASGGLLGIILGNFLGVVIFLVISQFLNISWSFSFPWLAALVGLTVSATTGLVFGIYPARQAARKSPIEALRYE